MTEKIRQWYKAVLAVLLLCCMSLMPALPTLAQEAARQVIRVAFPEQESISTYREDGRPTGYNYEYLEKLSEFTGWKLEYVRYEAEDENQALEEAIADLEAGKVDLLGPLLKLAATEEQFEYPEQSYGSVYTTLCTLNTGSIREDNIFFQKPLRVGLLKKAEIRNKEVEEYLDAQKAEYAFCYYETEEEQTAALKNGEVDVISGVSLSPRKDIRIVKRFAPRPYYFVSTKGNTALIEQMDAAIERLHQMQPNFQSELFEKYFSSAGAEFTLTDDQREFLASVGTLHVLCVDNDGPYVFQKDGQAAGMLVSAIDDFAAQAGIAAEYTFCQNRSEAENRLTQSDYDILIGTPFTSEYCSSIGFITSEKIMESNFLLAYRESNTKRETVALVNGAEHQVDTSGYRKIVLYDNTAECLDVVKKAEVDVAIGDRSILEYYNNGGAGSLNVTLLTGQTQDICMALSQKCDPRLLGLINGYIYSLTDVEKTNYLDAGSVRAEKMSISLLVQTYPVQTLLIFSGLSAALVLLCGGFYYVRRMRRKNEELRLANEVRSDFLMRMSHDIRTPMNGIVGLLNISDRFVNEPEMIRKYHRKIHMASEYLLSLINDVLNMSKLESGKVYLARESVYLRETIDNCKDILETRANEQGVTLDVAGMEHFDPPRVFTSPLHLRQIFMNIIGNAIKYNKPNGRVEVSARILKQTEQQITCEFKVMDTGIGMSEEFQKHAFEAFSQENQDAHGELKGTGLGLSIVKRLVDAMGGRLSIASRLGEGSTFTLVLSFEIDTAYQEQPEEAAAQISSLHGKRVLAAEDNALNAEILHFLLTDAGMQVLITENGSQAVETFANAAPGSYDFILMDIMMPKMNGYEAAKAIRQLDRKDAKEIPIIALTANAYTEDKQKALAAGMNDHVAKPVDIQQLLRILKRYL